MVGERLAQGVAVVVVARDGMDRDAERREQLAHACVGARVPVVGEVAGDEHRVGLRVEREEGRHRGLQRVGRAEIVGTDREVQIGELGDEEGSGLAVHAGVIHQGGRAPPERAEAVMREHVGALERQVLDAIVAQLPPASGRSRMRSQVPSA